MPINIKSQKDSLTTDVVIDLPTNLNEIDQLMRSSKATGRVVATYNQGGLLGVNVGAEATHVRSAFRKS